MLSITDDVAALTVTWRCDVLITFPLKSLIVTVIIALKSFNRSEMAYTFTLSSSLVMLSTTGSNAFLAM